MTDAKHVQDALDRAYAGGPERHHEKSREQGKLPVRERVGRLLDEGSFTEDALLASDPTVKAGSWGPKTVEKILRIQDTALSLRIPMVYLVDSAGARITEQVQMFPGRRHAGRI